MNISRLRTYFMTGTIAATLGVLSLVATNYPRNISFSDYDFQMRTEIREKAEELQKKQKNKHPEYQREKKEFEAFLKTHPDIILALGRTDCYTCQQLHELVKEKGYENKFVFRNLDPRQGYEFIDDILYDDGRIGHPVIYLPLIAKFRDGKPVGTFQYDGEEFKKKGMLYPFIHPSYSLEQVIE